MGPERSTSEEPVLVTLVGEYDIANAQAVFDRLVEPAGSAPVIADLRQVGFMDSSALSQLVRASRRLEDAGRALTLLLPTHGAVARVLAVTQIDVSIPSARTLDHAMALAVSAPGPA